LIGKRLRGRARRCCVHARCASGIVIRPCGGRLGRVACHERKPGVAQERVARPHQRACGIPHLDRLALGEERCRIHAVRDVPGAAQGCELVTIAVIRERGPRRSAGVVHRRQLPCSIVAVARLDTSRPLALIEATCGIVDVCGLVAIRVLLALEEPGWRIVDPFRCRCAGSARIILPRGQAGHLQKRIGFCLAWVGLASAYPNRSRCVVVHSVLGCAIR